MRRRALEAGIDLRQVRGTGPAGRIGHDDLDAYLDAPPEEAAPAPAGRVARTGVEEIKVIGLRRRIAQRMADAKRRVAHFSYVEEVDVTAVEELRAALNGLAARDELSGSTITITSLGALGGIVTTPVINRPEVAIIGVNKQVMRPVWRDGAFVPRLTMNLSASFDHRVVDGYDAALFVQALKGLLETPATLFMEA